MSSKQVKSTKKELSWTEKDNIRQEICSWLKSDEYRDVASEVIIYLSQFAYHSYEKAKDMEMKNILLSLKITELLQKIPDLKLPHAEKTEQLKQWVDSGYKSIFFGSNFTLSQSFTDLLNDNLHILDRACLNSKVRKFYCSQTKLWKDPKGKMKAIVAACDKWVRLNSNKVEYEAARDKILEAIQDKNIKKLDLSQFNLDSLPPSLVFTNLSHIEEFHFKARVSYKYLPQSIKELKNVRRLYLKSSSFERLPPTFFKGLPQLTELQLEQKSITLTPMIFKEATNLKR